MGKQKLGDFIRKIDYLKAKSGNDYADSSENPGNQLLDVEHGCKDISFDELKDAFLAFEEKVCIKGFPERHSPAYWVAYSTMCVLNRLTSSFVSDHEEMESRMAEVQLHTLVALVKAGPGTTHCEMMDKLIGTDTEDYAKTLGVKELAVIMEAAKMTFKYIPNDDCDERVYGTLQHGSLRSFFQMFSEEQYKLAQKEILDTYLHCASQIPSLTEKYAQQIYYTVRDMLDSFEDRNPYLGLKDTGIIKKHLKAIKEMVYSKSYAPKSPTEDIVEQMLRNLVKAILKNGIVVDVFEDMASLIVEVGKTSDVRSKAKEIYDIYRCIFFRNMEEFKVPVVKIFRSCCALTNTVLKQEEVTQYAVSLLDDVIDAVILKSKPLAAEDVKEGLTMVNTLLESGQKNLIGQGEDVLEHMKKIKALDWKKHTEAAAKIFDIIAQIPKERMQDDDKSSLHDTVSAYKSFIKRFLEHLKRSKVLQQLQASIVKFCFDNLVISPPVKTELAEESSGRDFLDFSKHEILRLEVLQKSEKLLKNKDLPWEDRDLGTTVSNLLRTVVESYDGNGKAVTKEENTVFMSIFNIVSEGGESVVDHFYEEENEEIPNVKMKIWMNVVMEYTRVHQSTGTLASISPFMPEVLRWSKIALEDDHDDMMHLCFGILNWVGLSTPIELKSCLPDIMSLMIESGRCNELYSLVNTLYPYNPAAVHDRLQDLFDGLDHLKDNERHIVTALFQTISTKHPEAFTKKQISMMFDMYKKGNEAGKPLLLIIIRAIAEKYPKNLVDFFPQLCDSKMFKPESMNLRSGILVCIGGVNEQLGQKTVDYLMKYVDYADPTTSHIVVGTVSTLVRKHKDYMQKYRPKLVKLEKISTVPAVRDLAHDMILVLDGLSVESIAEDLQQQQEDIEELDTKVDATIDTVVTIGDKVIEHDKEIGELGEGLERVEERVDDVEEDLGDTKIKVEEIDNKTMTNAPKWSRDLTKLMNPTAENDWRLLASRLGYSNDDIRSWAQQHDPCMAVLSEWYATHKTSEASFGVLTALTEMNRMDGVAIVENAMKAAEGVVEDEEFEYPSPPAVFISYQWGVQNEVKLLKQHLNMAGYECWLDVGQMGGGDKLFSKIDNGIRGAKVVISCVTEKYAKSPNCNREVNLSVNLNKPIIPLLMEKMDWPPVGSMGPIFSEYLFIRFFQRSGEETKEKDQRYWPIPKFRELLMQLNFFVVPDQKMVKKEYANWWAPIIEEIVVDKAKGKKQGTSQKTKQNEAQVVKSDASPQIFLSYQWGKQPQIMALYKRLTSLGYTVWMDIYQMGGGDSLYDKIDRGMRGCKAVVSCITLKYSLSANCRREISLADALKKPIIPLLLEQMKWPPDGPMSMVFTELLFINFYRDESVQMTWTGDKFDELTSKLGQHLPVTDTSTDKNENVPKGKSQTKSSTVNKTVVTKASTVKALESPTAKGKPAQGSETTNKSKQRDSARNDVGQEKSKNNAKKSSDHTQEEKIHKSPSGKSDNGTTNQGKTELKSNNPGKPRNITDKQIGKETETVVSETATDKTPKTQQKNGSSEKNEKVNDHTQNNQDARSKSCTIL